MSTIPASDPFWKTLGIPIAPDDHPIYRGGAIVSFRGGRKSSRKLAEVFPQVPVEVVNSDTEISKDPEPKN